MGLKQFPTLGAIVKIFKIIRENKISVVNVHGLGMILWGKLISIISGVRVIATYHPSVQGDHSNIYQRSLQGFSLLQKTILRTCCPSNIIVLSAESHKFLESQCSSISSRIVKIFGGIDTKYFRPPDETERSSARRSFDLKKSDILCILVGRVNWNKGHDILIKAIRSIRDEHKYDQIRCFFIGSEVGSSEIKELCFESDRDQETFRFCGFVSDVRPYFWAADVFVLPSRLEGFALVVAEAMAAGIVPIRTPSGGAVDQIVEGKTGFIVPFEDHNRLSEAIMSIFDDQKRAVLAENCVRRATDTFSLSTIGLQLTKLYGMDLHNANIRSR